MCPHGDEAKITPYLFLIIISGVISSEIKREPQPNEYGGGGGALRC